MNCQNRGSIKESDFRALFESIPGLYLVLTPSFTIVAASDAYLKATKTERSAILGRGLFEVFPDNPDDPNATGTRNLHASLERVLKNKKADVMAVQKYDIRRPEFEGGGFEERHWSPINSPVLNSTGEVTYIIHRVEDVSEFVRLKQSRLKEQKATDELRLRLEESESEIFLRAKEIQEVNRQLIDSNNSLAQKEKELTEARDVLQKELASGQQDLRTLANELSLRKQELQRAMEEMRYAKDEALRASQVKSQFLANMSHEIRTPLGIILGFTELLLDPSLSRSERENFITRVRHSGQHLLSLLNEILDVTKIEAGHLDIEYSDVIIAELLTEVTLVFEPSANQKGLKLRIYRQEGLPESFRCDRTKLRQILINLISNAIKFCKVGTIDVHVENSPRSSQPEIIFRVTDHGPGISPPYVDHLFEEFSQADNSMTRKHGGSGLGLALSRKLARALGGDIELVATDSRGSVFAVRLPLDGPSMSSSQPAKVVSLSAKKNENMKILKNVRVLVVDDSPDNLALARYILEKVGATIETAADGLEGVEKAITGLHDLVLMDIQMPQLNGYEATAQLRAKGYRKPIIALTAHAMKEDQEKCISSGCNDYLAKPVVAATLIDTIHKILAEQVPLSPAF